MTDFYGYQDYLMISEMNLKDISIQYGYFMNGNRIQFSRICIFNAGQFEA